MTVAVVVGATSYIGQFVIEALLDSDFEVMAVTRRPDVASILLGHQLKRIALATPAEAEHARGDVEAVINLAYVKTALPHRLSHETKALAESVDRIAVSRRTPRVIHVSTIAVFGFDLRIPPKPVAAPQLRGNPYIETKAATEELMSRAAKARGYSLAIVRLGNVIGPGSPTWTVSLAQRLLECRPVAYSDRLGFSNTTYVGNVAAYLVHLVRVSADELNAFGHYHHHVEFAHRSWAEVLAPIERTMGVSRRVVASVGSARQRSLRAQVFALLRSTYRRTAGWYVRALLGRFPRWSWLGVFVSRMKALEDPLAHVRAPAPSEDDQTFARIMEATACVQPHVLRGWTPPADFETAIQRINDWLTYAGYVVRRNP
jgi:nucleoside-diphosphate-sugar epimerase